MAQGDKTYKGRIAYTEDENGIKVLKLNEQGTHLAPVANIAALEAINVDDAILYPDRIGCFVKGLEVMFYLHREDTSNPASPNYIIVGGGTQGYRWKRAWEPITEVETSDDIDEGDTNLFFTEERARASFSEGTGIEIDAFGVIKLDTTIDAYFASVRGILRAEPMTSAQINAIEDPVAGMIVYNTTIDGLVAYVAGSWSQIA